MFDPLCRAFSLSPKQKSTLKVRNAYLHDEPYMSLTKEIGFLWFGFNKWHHIAIWFGIATGILVVDLYVTIWYFSRFNFLPSGIYGATGFVKLLIKWVVIREKKVMISHDNRIYNVIEYRIWRLRYYDTYVGRVCINVPFDWVTVFLMEVSVIHILIFFPSAEDATEFEFINTVFCYTFFSAFLLTFNKVEACRLTFGRLWWLYLSYYTFDDPSIVLSGLYVLIFVVTNAALQLRIVNNYFGYPSVEEYAFVRCPSFRHAHLVLGATKFCMGFNEENEYCVTDARNYRSIAEPRFFTLGDMQDIVPETDIWKWLEKIENKREFHRKHDLADCFKYLNPSAFCIKGSSRRALTWKGEFFKRIKSIVSRFFNLRESW